MYTDELFKIRRTGPETVVCLIPLMGVIQATHKRPVCICTPLALQETTDSCRDHQYAERTSDYRQGEWADLLDVAI